MKITPLLLVLAVIVLSLPPAAHAQTNTWTNTGGGSWDTAANWSLNSVPVSTTPLNFTNGNYTITATGDVAGGGWNGSPTRTGRITFDLGADNTLTAGGEWRVRGAGVSFLSGNYSMAAMNFGQATGSGGSSIIISGDDTTITTANISQSITASSANNVTANVALTISNGATLTASNTGTVNLISAQSTDTRVTNNSVVVTGAGSALSIGTGTSTLRLFNLGNNEGNTGGQVSGNSLVINDGAVVDVINLQMATRTTGAGTVLSNNTVTVGGTGTGAALNIAGDLTVGQNGISTDNGITVNAGGSVNVTGNATLNTNSGSFIRVDGGSLAAGNFTVNNNDVRMTAGSMVIADFNNNSTTGGFGNAAEANNRFAGGMLLVGKMDHRATDYTFSVGDGVGAAASAVYDMTGHGTHQFANNMTIASDGLLTGNGRISGSASTNAATTLTLNGRIAPGNSAGAITVVGDLTAGSGAEFLFELGGTSSYDQLLVTGNLNFGGTLRLSLINGFTLSNGDSFNLFDFATSSGSLGYDLPTLGGGLSWDTAQVIDSGIISVVPEPSTYGLLVLAAAGLACHVVRRRRS